jgi:hypothetical protein
VPVPGTEAKLRRPQFFPHPGEAATFLEVLVAIETGRGYSLERFNVRASSHSLFLNRVPSGTRNIDI